MNALYLAFKTTLVHQLLVSIITDQLIKHCHQWDKEYNARQAKQFSPMRAPISVHRGESPTEVPTTWG